MLGLASGELIAQGESAFNQPAVMKYGAGFATVWSVSSFDSKDVEPVGTDCMVIGGQHSADITLDGATSPRRNGSGQENAIASFLCAGGLGLEDASTLASIGLYPNPAHELLQLAVPDQDRMLELDVYALDGHMCMRIPGDGCSVSSVHIGALAPGHNVVKGSGGGAVGRFGKG